MQNQAALLANSNHASSHVTKFSSFITLNSKINLLPTAIVFVKDSFDNLQPLRALLDSCSEVDLITQEAVNRLRLKQCKSVQEISGVSNVPTRLKHLVTTTVKSRVSAFEWTSNFLVTKSISSHHPAESIKTSNWKIPNGIELADSQLFIAQRIDILICSEIFFELLLDGKISLGSGYPNLINTFLGWFVGGNLTSQRKNRSISYYMVTKSDNLGSLLKAF